MLKPVLRLLLTLFVFAFALTHGRAVGQTLGATVYSKSIPTTMVAGQSYSVMITMKNTGTQIWYPASGDKLGAVNDTMIWGVGRVELSGAIPVGDFEVFQFNVTAPTTPGTYTFAYRMLEEYVTWFGATASQTVTVVAPINNAPVASISSPSDGARVTASGTTGSIYLSASGSDNDGSVTQMRWQLDGGGWNNVSGSSIATWVSANVGSHTLKVVAVDNAGATSSEITRTFYVDAPQTPLPTIAITRTPKPMVANQLFSASWSTTNATSVTYSCAPNGSIGYSASGSGGATGSLPSGTAQSAWVGNPSTCSYTAIGPGGSTTYQEPVETISGTLGATVYSKSIPTRMVVGQSYSVTITMKNTGTRTWHPADGVKLGAVNDTSIWGVGRVEMSTSVPVNDWEVFQFTVTPTTAGTHTFAYRMLQEGSAWFGGTASQTVTVDLPPPPTIAITRTPSPMVANQSFSASWSTTNATSVSYSCTPNGSIGYSASGSGGASGSLPSGTAQSAWVGNPSTCTYTVTGPGGTVTQQEQVETVAAPVLSVSLNAANNNVRVASGGSATVTFTGTASNSTGQLTSIELYQSTTSGYGATPVKTISVPSGTSHYGFNTSLVLTAGVYRFKAKVVSGTTKLDSNEVFVNVTSSPLLGSVLGVRQDRGEEPHLVGWACRDTSTEALSINVWKNAPNATMGGTNIYSGTANLSTDPGNATVQGLCHTPGTGHHFSLSTNTLSATGGGTTTGIPEGTALYVEARTADGASIILPCEDNRCTMPGAMRIGIATPADGSTYIAPANVFASALIKNATAPFDEVAIGINGDWVAATPDATLNSYYINKPNLAASATPYQVQARVRKGVTTMFSTVNLITVLPAGSVIVTLADPGSVTVGSQVTLRASISGSSSAVNTVRFLAGTNVIATATDGSLGWNATWIPASAGSYNLMAEALDGNGVSLGKSASVPVTVSTNSAGATPSPWTLPLPHTGKLDAGSLPGELEVSATGAATYTIPIVPVPGTAGMIPELALAYNSQSDNGSLGMGWHVAGPSSINRCEKTLAKDGMAGRISFDNTDRLCLDGMRLYPHTSINHLDDASYWSASEYRTDPETFAKVTRTGSGFKVQYKDGRTAYFGTTPDSRRLDIGRTGSAVLGWALAQLEDRAGNAIRYAYTQSAQGEFLLSKISYGANINTTQRDYAAIRIVYDTARSDGVTRYIGGARDDVRHRLTNVQTYVGTDMNGDGGTVVRDYRLAYSHAPQSGRLRLDSVTVCAGGKCLPATTFSYGTGTTPAMALSNAPKLPYGYTEIIDGSTKPIEVFGIFDASGRTGRATFNMLVCSDPPLPSCQFGFLPPRMDGKVEIVKADGTIVATTIDLAAMGFGVTGSAIAADVMVGDLNNDGVDDLIISSSSGRPWGYCITTPTAGAPTFACGAGDNQGAATLADLFGDRRAHVISVISSSQVLDCKFDGTAMSCTPMQASGLPGTLDPNLGGYNEKLRFSTINASRQGVQDFFSAWSGWVPSTDGTGTTIDGTVYKWSTGANICYFKNGTLNCHTLDSFLSNDAANGAKVTGTLSTGDLNGDGLSDFLYAVKNAGGRDGVYVCLSKEGGADCRKDPAISTELGKQTIDRVLVGDFLGEGGAQLYFRPKSDDGSAVDDAANADAKLCRYKADAFQCVTITAAPKVEQLGSIEHNGAPTFLVKANKAGGGFEWAIYTLAQPASSDRIVSARNGLGFEEQVDYARGDDAAVYSRDASYLDSIIAPTTEQVRTVPPVMAKQQRHSNGAGGWITHDHHYQGATLNTRGYGFVGFAVSKETDAGTGIASTTRYQLDFPFIGQPHTTRTISATGTVLSETSNEWLVQGASAGNNIWTRLPYLWKSRVVRNDLDGTALPTVETEFGYGDGWGNPTVVTETVSDSAATFVKQVTTGYLNDATNWQIGLPTSTTTLRKRVGEEAKAITRTVTQEYDAKGLLRVITVEPGSAPYQVRTTIDRSNNSFGLVGSETQEWTNPATSQLESRSRVTLYEPMGRFIKELGNFKGQKEVHAYDSPTGVLTSRTDINGQTVTQVVDALGRVGSVATPDGNRIQTDVKQCAGGCELPAAAVRVTARYHGAAVMGAPELEFFDTTGKSVGTMTYGLDQSPLLAERAYDPRGRLKAIYWPRAQAASNVEKESYTYDELDRARTASTRDEQGNTATWTTIYSGAARISFRQDQSDARKRTELRDALGRMRSVTDVLGGTTSFEYDAFDNVVKTTDVAGNVINVKYDILGRKIELADPDLGTITYKVDPLGRTYASKSPKQSVDTTYEFDKLDRMTKRSEPDLISNWVYDTAVNGVGKLAEEFTGTTTTKNYSKQYTYDSLGRLTSEVVAPISNGIGADGFTTRYVYDDWGRLSQRTHQRNTDAEKKFDFRYHVTGLLDRIENSGLPLWKVTERDAMQRVTEAALGNGLKRKSTYNPHSGRYVSGSLLTGANAAVVEDSYAYDTFGNLRNRVLKNSPGYFSEDFTYDGLDRIKTSTVSGQAPKSYEYYLGGNLKLKSDVGPGNYLYPTPGSPRPHAVQATSGTTANILYDANGNLESGFGLIASWTSFNMPITITRGGVSATFTYGPNHERVRQVTNGMTYVYGGAQQTETSSGSTVVKTYWPNGLGYEVQQPNGTISRYWFYTDNLGSVIGTTDSNGAPIHAFAYDAWGAREGTNGSGAANLAGVTDRRGYTAHEMLDGLGLIHMNGRVFDPLLGRFLSADPYVTDAENGESYSRYSYVLNNPLRFIDPTGYSQCFADSDTCTVTALRDPMGLTLYTQLQRMQRAIEQAIERRGARKASAVWPARNPVERLSFTAQLQSGWDGGNRSVMWPETAGEQFGRYGRVGANFLINLMPGASFPEIGRSLGQQEYGMAVILAVSELAGPLGKGLRTASAAEKTAYSVVFETTIAKTGAGDRGTHKALANTNLNAAVAADAEFGQMMSKLGVSPVVGNVTPAGFQWHHVKGQPGIMQLVPVSQHSPGSVWQKVLHPENSGGYAEWGKSW